MTKAKHPLFVPSSPATEDAPAPGNDVTDADTLERVARAVGAAEDHKALDLKVLELREVSDFTDYFLVCSGTSERHVQTIAEAVNEALREQGLRPLHLEGLQEGQWVLLDYGDVVVHVFQERKRDFYRLESLWSDAPDVTQDFVA